MKHALNKQLPAEILRLPPLPPEPPIEEREARTLREEIRELRRRVKALEEERR